MAVRRLVSRSEADARRSDSRLHEGCRIRCVRGGVAWNDRAGQARRFHDRRGRSLLSAAVGVVQSEGALHGGGRGDRLFEPVKIRLHSRRSIPWLARSRGAAGPPCSMMSVAIFTHASQMYTFGPATSFSTSSSLLLQKEHRRRVVILIVCISPQRHRDHGDVSVRSVSLW